MKRNFAKILTLLLVLVMAVSMTVLSAMATTQDILSSQISVTDTLNNNSKVSETAVTIKAGKINASQTNTVTITNKTSDTAKLSFNYTVSSYSTFIIDGNAGAASGSFSKVVNGGESITLTLSNNKGWSGYTATLKMTDFALEVLSGSANLTFKFDGSGGNVTADGSAVTDGTVKGVSVGTSISATATPNSGYSFLGWVDAATRQVLSTSTSTTLTPAADVTAEAVFTKTTPHYIVENNGANYLYSDLDTAIAAAQSGSSQTVVLANNATLPAGTYTIPAGITLLIPYDAANTVHRETPGQVNEEYSKPTAYRTLTMASGATLTVNGELCVSGRQNGKMPYNGHSYGPVGFVNMNSESSILVQSGGKLYAWGYITGSGEVEILSGGYVYESFQLTDFRGGDATSQMAKSGHNSVFPMSQYFIQNVEVPMKLHAGCVEQAYMSAYITLAQMQGALVPFIGSNNAMFSIQNGYVMKDYIESTGRLSVKAYGDITVSTVSMSMKTGALGSTTINSKEYNLPISNHMTVEAVSGSVTLAQNLVLFPGSELYIREGVTCTLTSGVRIIAYDADQWGGYCGSKNMTYVPLQYPVVAGISEDRLKDALVQIDGTIDVSAGAIYATEGGANIYSTGTGKVIAVPGAETETYYAIQSVETSLIGDSQKLDYYPVAIKPVMLKNADGTYTETATADTYTYNVRTGNWDDSTHVYSTVEVAATCTTDGYKGEKCSACDDLRNVVTLPATGHTEVVLPVVAPTCTEGGMTEGKKCSVCGEILLAQEILESLDHDSVVDAAVDATCTTPGWTEGMHCDRCGEVLIAQNEIPAPGHTEAVDAAVEPGCNTTGLTEGKHCSACGEILVAQETVAAKGHTEAIDQAVAATCTTTGLTEGKHCSACNEEIVAQEEVPVLGHSYGDWTVTTAPTYTQKGQKTKICGRCKAVVTEELDILPSPVEAMRVTLADDICLNFKTTLTADDTVTVTVGGAAAECTVTDGVLFVEVTAAQMTDAIAISVNGNPLAESYSIRDYGKEILDGDYDETTKNLVKSMLCYGAAAQQYFAYKTDDLANSDVTGFTPTAPEGIVTGRLSGKLENLQYYGATLLHKNRIAVRIYFTGDAEGLTFTVNGTATEVQENETGYYVEVGGYNPQDLENAVTVEVTDAEGNIMRVSYSPMDYILRMYNKESSQDTTKALVKALYSYYLAAKAHLA